jgi:phosphate transport system substrate-binding protein
VLVDGFATRDNTGIMNAMTIDEFGIGYVSLSSVNDTIKALQFDGVDPTIENVINDTYGLKRPFNYITRAAGDYESTEIEQIANAFIVFLHSTDGSDIINDEGAIALPSTYTWESVAGDHPICAQDNSTLTLKFGGSDSIQKIAEALSAAFSPRCGNVQTNNDHTGSSDGYKRTQGEEKDSVNSKHIGYASRPFRGDEVDLTDPETRGQLAWDAIVAIVHLDNPVDNLTAEQLRKIYSGELLTWQEVLED